MNLNCQTWEKWKSSLSKGILTIFLYEDEGKYFIEQTYNGVYKIPKEAYAFPHLINGIRARGMNGVNYGIIGFPILIGIWTFYKYKNQNNMKEVKRMRHIYIRGIIGLIWLITAIVCGASGNFPMMGLYIILAGVFLYSAYAAWKKEKDGKGGR